MDGSQSLVNECYLDEFPVQIHDGKSTSYIAHRDLFSILCKRSSDERLVCLFVGWLVDIDGEMERAKIDLRELPPRRYWLKHRGLERLRRPKAKNPSAYRPLGSVPIQQELHPDLATSPFLFVV